MTKISGTYFLTVKRANCRQANKVSFRKYKNDNLKEIRENRYKSTLILNLDTQSYIVQRTIYQKSLHEIKVG